MKNDLSSLSAPAKRSSQAGENCSLSPELSFEERLKQIVRPGDRILDAGCGEGKFFSLTFAKEMGCHVSGVDASARIALNSILNVRIRGDLTRLPFARDSFDLVNCRLVVEHLENPETVFREFHRILRPGGSLAIFTPNLLHYFGAAAHITPTWFHVWFNSRIRGFEEQDVFPTYYRANTRQRMQALLRTVGFGEIEISLVEGAPSVLAFNSFLYHIGTAYKRLVDRFTFLAGYRLNIIAISYKA